MRRQWSGRLRGEWLNGRLLPIVYAVMEELKKDGISATLICFIKIARSQENPSLKSVCPGRAITYRVPDCGTNRRVRVGNDLRPRHIFFWMGDIFSEMAICVPKHVHL